MKKKKHNRRAQTLSQLIKVWDRKLKSHGFNDIENRVTGQLKKSGGDVYWDAFRYEEPIHEKNKNMGYTTATWKESQAEYFRLAGIYLHEREFKNHRFRLVWQLHAEGLSLTEIGEIMNISRDKANRMIRDMAREFCLKPP